MALLSCPGCLAVWAVYYKLGERRWVGSEEENWKIEPGRRLQLGDQLAEVLNRQGDSTDKENSATQVSHQFAEPELKTDPGYGTCRGTVGDGMQVRVTKA